MGFNTRDREHDLWVRTRAREVRRLEDAGRALHLIVAGTKAFNDKSFVTRVLDRLHRERGIGVLLYAGATRTTYHADRWAQSRRVGVRWVPRADLVRQAAHGVVAFGGPEAFVARARAAGLAVWEPRGYPLVSGPAIDLRTQARR